MQTATDDPASLAHAMPIDLADRHRARLWDEVPLRVKIVLLTLVAAAGGSLIGIAEVELSYTVWPLCIGLTLLVAILIALIEYWVLSPINRLIRQVDRVAQQHRISPDTERLRALATARRDELGKLSRLVHQIATTALQDHREIKQLRRTLDHRITEATQLATNKLRQLAMHDELTSLGNRRFLDQHLEPLVSSVLQSGSDLVCIMIDMDNFKHVNDTQGHTVGDELLILLASLIRALTRPEDYAVRLGGDEFTVLMPGCSPKRAGELLKRMRELFGQHTSTAMQIDPPPDLSAGIASLRRDGLDSGQQLLEMADTNLYAAKHAGKGCIGGA